MPRRVFIFLKKTGNSVSYLPHRQLRNKESGTDFYFCCYLPHRQLRNYEPTTVLRIIRYLPHRQLRNVPVSIHR